MTATTHTDPLPPGYGDGWLTGNGRDMLRIAVTLAGFPRDELLRRVALAPTRGERANLATVERIMGELDADLRAVTA